MSTSPSLLHPPYALPRSLAAPSVAWVPSDAFSAPALLLAPYVPRGSRPDTVTPVGDASKGSPRPSGVRLDTTPSHSAAVLAQSDALPSIEAFLLEAPVDAGAATMAALFSSQDREVEAAIEAGTSAATDAELAEADDAWAIADASDAVAELADGLTGHVSDTDASHMAAPASDRVQEPLEPWTEDERWMDIMPALQTPGGPDLAGETAWARAFAEPPAPMTPTPLPAGDTEAAAASLEAVARRLRAGELDVPGFHGDRGDAAALAAALAALLGARG